MKLQPIVPKNRGDKFMQDAVRAWREQGLYPDWLSHLLSYIPYEKLDQCGVWLESIDSTAGSCSFRWDDETKVAESLQQVCKALTAIFHHIGAIPQTKTVEYSPEWVEIAADEYKGENGDRELVGFDLSFNPIDEHSGEELSFQIKSLLSEDVEPLGIKSVVGMESPISHLSVPFVNKRGLALHYMDMGMSLKQVHIFLRQYLNRPKFDLGVYPVQVTNDREMWRFKNYNSQNVKTASEYREDEGVAIARKAGYYNALLEAVLQIFEEKV